jgi:hypothetical protein
MTFQYSYAGEKLNTMGLLLLSRDGRQEKRDNQGINSFVACVMQVRKKHHNLEVSALVSLKIY